MASSAESDSLGKVAERPRRLVRLLPLRERVILLSGLGVVTLLAWVYLLDRARAMKGPAMGAPWSRDDFLAMLAMWVIMMIGMMVPSAIPMIWIHAGIARKAARDGLPTTPTWLFVLGYVVIWSLFGIGATVAQWGLDRASLLGPMMRTKSSILGGILLLLAGLYQLTPVKEACLRHCRSPVNFIADRWRPGRLGAIRMGLAHGLYCLGCCWILMGLLFFGGVMSLWWIGGLTLFVLLEKFMPYGGRGGSILGLLLATWGAVLLLSGLGWR